MAIENNFIGDSIRKCRTEKYYSQRYLASLMETHSNTISRWETGTYMPSALDMARLANYLGVSMNVLYDTVPPPLEPSPERKAIEMIAGHLAGLAGGVVHLTGSIYTTEIIQDMDTVIMAMREK